MPGSQIFEDLLKKGKAEKRWDRYLAHSQSPMENSLCEISQSGLQAIQRSAFWRFYFRPKYILRKILLLRSPTALLGMIRGAYMIILFNIQTLLDRRRGRK